MLTESQQICLREQGNVLVVAGAGTGKTSTLVERCVHLLLEEQCSLEEILMVTFTEAAAAEMRDRIRTRLREVLQNCSGEAGDHIQRQLSLLDTAQICTLHSFCLRLVRQHFHQLGIAPAVLVLDEKQTAPLIAQTFDALFAGYYEGKDPESRAVLELVSSLGRGSEETLRRLTLKVYRYAQSLEDPEGWLARQLELYQQSEPAAWREWLTGGFESWRGYWEPELQQESGNRAIELFLEALHGVKKVEVKQGQAVPASNAIISAILAIQEADQNNENWPRGSKTKVRNQFVSFLKDVEFLRTALVPETGQPDPLQQDWDWARPRVCALLRLVMEFSSRFTEAKRELGGVDFSDQEQLALRLLREPAIARQWQERLRFIFVDEFQDINRAQDAILRLVSREGKDGQPNRFLVGDVKQSIYRFRRANPKIFGEYEEKWRGESKQPLTPTLSPSDEAREERAGRRVPLSDNFRSREALLDFVNAFFSSLMRPAIGGVAYEADVHLQFGNAKERQDLSRNGAKDCTSTRVELHLIDEANEESESENNGEEAGPGSLDLLTVEREARLAALCLRDLKQQQHAIWDAGQKRFRPVEWGDMVVLLRSPSNRVEAFAKEFHRVGIPLAAARSGFYRSLEISDLLNVLRLLDNPLQDIPLLAVLRSPLAGLSLDELVEIRTDNRQKPFWFALKEFHEHKEKTTPHPDPLPVGRGEGRTDSTAWSTVDVFLRQFEHWRLLVRQTSLSVCMERILADTHYEALLLAEARGEERLANVRRLLDLIREYDPWQRQGLYRFLRFLESQEEAEVDQEPASAQTEDAVRLMSIHKSKGLEFPLVLLAGLGGLFNSQDVRDEILLHETYGLCPKVRPPDCLQSYPSVAYWLAKQAEQRELLGEELRLLYVAMTRARDTLLLVGAAKNPSWREDEANADETGARLSDRALMGARSYWDWLKKWLAQTTNTAEWTSELQGQSSLLRWSLYAADDSRLKTAEDTEAKIVPEKGEPLEAVELLKLQERILFKYPHDAATHAPAIKRISEIIWNAPEPREDLQLFLGGFASKTPLPSHGRGSSRRTKAQSSKRDTSPGYTAAQIGDATHRFLESVPLDRVGSLAGVREAAEEMLKDGVLNPEELKALNLDGIVAFWNSKIGRRILASPQQIHRELPFTMRLLPEDLQRLEICPQAEELKGERFVGRGKVDLAVIQPKEIWILDFKTDRVAAGDLADKVAVYGKQLKLYGLALSQIYRRPVTERWLHFLAVEKTISIQAIQ